MKKQSQNKPNSNPIKACPERSRMGQFQRFICSAGLGSFFAAIRAAAHVTWLSTIFFADFQPAFLIPTKKISFE